MKRLEAIRIITIAREYGSGGSLLARSLGERLGWPVIDRALIQEVARRLELQESDVEALDEHVGGLLERLGRVFTEGTPELPVLPSVPEPDSIAAAERALIREAAGSPPVILVGHGAQCLLRDRTDALHLRVGAELSDRARWIAERRHIDEAGAEEDARRIDADRGRYLRHHFGCEWDDPSLYDLQLSTSAMDIEEATTLVATLVEARSHAAQPNRSEQR